MPRKKARAIKKTSAKKSAAKRRTAKAAPASVLKEIEALERDAEKAAGRLENGLTRAVAKTTKSFEAGRKRKASLSARKKKAMDKIRAANERLGKNKTAAARDGLAKARGVRAELLAQESAENAKLVELGAELATLKGKLKAFENSQKAATEALTAASKTKKKKRARRKAAAILVAEPRPMPVEGQQLEAV